MSKQIKVHTVHWTTQVSLGCLTFGTIFGALTLYNGGALPAWGLGFFLILACLSGCLWGFVFGAKLGGQIVGDEIVARYEIIFSELVRELEAKAEQAAADANRLPDPYVELEADRLKTDLDAFGRETEYDWRNDEIQ